MYSNFKTVFLGTNLSSLLKKVSSTVIIAPPKTDIAMENHHVAAKKIHLEAGSIFQPAMFVYRSVIPTQRRGRPVREKTGGRPLKVNLIQQISGRKLASLRSTHHPCTMGTHNLHFKGLQPIYIGSLKPSFFMGLEVQGYGIFADIF